MSPTMSHAGALVRAEFLAERHQQAAEAADQLDPARETDAALYREAAASCRAIGAWNKVAAHLESAVRFDPTSGAAWADLGEARYELRQLPGAEMAWHLAAALGGMDARRQRLRRIAALAQSNAMPEPAELRQLASQFSSFPNAETVLGQPGIPVMFALGAGHQREICLQIDDGPSPDLTPVILQVLRERDIKASFFVVGTGAARHPHLVRLIVDEGHAVYSHGFTHESFVTMDEVTLLDELERTEVLLRQHRPTPKPYLIRLPGGMGWDNLRVHQVLARFTNDAAIAHWSTDPRDYRVGSSFLNDGDLDLAARLCVLEAVLDTDLGGAVIITHDRMTTAPPRSVLFVRRFFEHLCDTLLQSGFKFVQSVATPVPSAAAIAAPAQASIKPPPVAVVARPVDPIQIRRIDSSNIASLAQRGDVNGLPLEAYIRTARLPWLNHQFPYAYAIEENGRFQGWLQSIYANRMIDGRIQTICNLSSWYVRDEFRSSSMRLMFQALRDAGVMPVTALTPSGLAANIYKSLRFTVLDFDRFAVPIQLEAGSQARGDGDEFFWQLSGRAKAVYNDHRMLPLQHCLITAPDGRTCYFAYKTRERYDIRVADLLYLDGAQDILVAPWRPPAGSELAQSQKLLIDSRFLRDQSPPLERMDPFNARYYRGPAELRSMLDYMYCEIPIYLPNMQ